MEGDGAVGEGAEEEGTGGEGGDGSQDSDSVLENLKNLGDNEAATEQVLAKITESMSVSSSSSSRRKRVSETITTEVYITRVTTFLSILTTNLYSSSVSSLSMQITQTIISGSFTSTQITTLENQRSSIVTQKSSFTSAKSALQEQYKTITGSYATTSEIRVGSSSSGTSNSLVQIKKLTVNRAAVASVLVKVEEAISGTSSSSSSSSSSTTVNVIEEAVFLTYIRNFNYLVRTDYFSETVRSSSLVITSASVTVTSTTLTSLTEIKTTISEELSSIDAKLTVIQSQITKLSGSTASSSQIALGSIVATESAVMEQSLAKLKIMTENKEAATLATSSMEKVRLTLLRGKTYILI